MRDDSAEGIDALNIVMPTQSSWAEHSREEIILSFILLS